MEDQEKNTIPRIRLRPEDAARALGVSRRKLHEITADQTSGIPVTRFGKVVLYPTAPWRNGWQSVRRKTMIDVTANMVYDPYMALLDDMRDAIENSGDTCYRIAADTGLSNSQLSRLMSGERGLRLDALEMLADHLGYRIALIPKSKGTK